MHDINTDNVMGIFCFDAKLCDHIGALKWEFPLRESNLSERKRHKDTMLSHIWTMRFSGRKKDHVRVKNNTAMWFENVSLRREKRRKQIIKVFTANMTYHLI